MSHLLKGDCVSVPIALDLQAAKLSLGAFSSPPDTRNSTLRRFMNSPRISRGRNCKKNVVDVDLSDDPMAVPFPLKGITVADEKLSAELFRVQ